MEWNLQKSLLSAFGLLLLLGSAAQWVTLLRRRRLPIASPSEIAANDSAPPRDPNLTSDGNLTAPAVPTAEPDEIIPAAQSTKPGRISGQAVIATLLWVGLSLFSSIRDELGISPEAEPSLDAVQLSCLINFALWGFMAWLLTDHGKRSFAEWGGRFPPRHYDVELGTKTFLLILLPVFVLLLATATFRSEENQHQFLQLLRDDATAATLFWLTVAAVVLAPLSEELMFRVILQGWLLARWPRHAAIVGTALLFAAVHGWPDAIPLIPLALILGYVNYHFRNYTAVVLAHALFNGLNLFLSVSSS